MLDRDRDRGRETECARDTHIAREKEMRETERLGSSVAGMQEQNASVLLLHAEPWVQRKS